MEKSSDKPAVLMQQDRSANSGIESESGQRTMALAVIKYASVSDREILLRWARDLLQIRDSDQSAFDKAEAAIRCTVESKAIMHPCQSPGWQCAGQGRLSGPAHHQPEMDHAHSGLEGSADSIYYLI
jgi:hypothetical protein